MFRTLSRIIDVYVAYCKANGLPLPKTKYYKNYEVERCHLSPPDDIIYHVNMVYRKSEN